MGGLLHCGISLKYTKYRDRHFGGLVGLLVLIQFKACPLALCGKGRISSKNVCAAITEKEKHRHTLTRGAEEHSAAKVR